MRDRTDGHLTFLAPRKIPVRLGIDPPMLRFLTQLHADTHDMKYFTLVHVHCFCSSAVSSLSFPVQKKKTPRCWKKKKPLKRHRTTKTTHTQTNPTLTRRSFYLTLTPSASLAGQSRARAQEGNTNNFRITQNNGSPHILNRTRHFHLPPNPERGGGREKGRRKGRGGGGYNFHARP